VSRFSLAGVSAAREKVIILSGLSVFAVKTLSENSVGSSGSGRETCVCDERNGRAKPHE